MNACLFPQRVPCEVSHKRLSYSRLTCDKLPIPVADLFMGDLNCKALNMTHLMSRRFVMHTLVVDNDIGATAHVPQRLITAHRQRVGQLFESWFRIECQQHVIAKRTRPKGALAALGARSTSGFRS